MPEYFSFNFTLFIKIVTISFQSQPFEQRAFIYPLNLIGPNLIFYRDVIRRKKYKFITLCLGSEIYMIYIGLSAKHKTFEGGGGPEIKMEIIIFKKG